MCWKIFGGALNSDILIDFFASPCQGGGAQGLPDPGQPARAPQQTGEGLAGRSTKHEIEVFYLPSYSPEFNRDEMANADLKQAVTKLAPARTKLQLVKVTVKHLRSVQRKPARIKRYFEHEPVRYAA